MEDNAKLIENLWERATEYSKSTYELVKLKIIDTILDVVSSLVTRYVAWAIFLLFMLFVSFGAALWLGEILGKTYYGFFIVGAFYCVLAIIFYTLFRKRFKKLVSDYIIKNELK